MSYETVRLEKGMYQVSGKSFAQVLEELDPTAQYAGTELGKLDAYERQLKRFDIQVSGKAGHTVERFFQTTESSALFPEFVKRAVQQGMEQNNLLKHLVVTVSHVQLPDYRTLTISHSETMGQAVAEGESMPVTTIATQKQLCPMKKHGRILSCSYEALRFHSLELFAVLLRQIGASIASEQLKEAVAVLTDGDGNNNPAEMTALTASPSYEDLLSLWGKLSPHTLTTLVTSTKTAERLLQLPQLQDSKAGLAFHGTGTVGTPLGAKLLHLPDLSDGQILGLDCHSALELVQAGPMLLDYDKLVDRQLERAGISVLCGFAKVTPDAVHGLTFSV